MSSSFDRKWITDPTPEKPGRTYSDREKVNGWVALGSTALLFLMPASPPHTESAGLTGFVTLYGLGFTFGLAAVRRGGEASRVAGALALVPLVFLLIVLILRGIVHWEDVVFYWTR